MAISVGAILKGIKTAKTVWKNRKAILVILCIFIGVPIIAIMSIILAPITFVASLADFFTGLFDSGEMSQADIEAAVRDAGSLKALMESSDYDPFEDSILMIDRETILRILGAVADYNEEVTDVTTFNYYYRVETGNRSNMPDIDPLTGEIIEEPEVQSANVIVMSGGLLFAEEESTEAVPSAGARGIVKPSQVGNGGATIVRPGFGNDSGFTQNTGQENSGGNGNGVHAPIIPNPAVTAMPMPSPSATPQPTAAPTPTPVPYTVRYERDTVELARVGIDYDVRGGEKYENVFYMEWQPVVTLCAMYIQSNSENWGTYNTTNEDGEYGYRETNYYLSDEEIDAIIDIFAYKYVYVKDVTRSNYFPDSFASFMEDGECGFHLSVNTEDESSGGVEKIVRTTKRVPSIMPQRIYNSYISYVYNYEELDEVGNVYVKSRTYTAQPSKLVNAFENMVGGFNKSVFLYMLKMMPLTQEQVVYYRDVIFGEDNQMIDTITTTNVEVCPVVGSVLAREGFESAFGGGASIGGTGGNFWESGPGGVGGLGVSGEDYVIPLYGINGWGNRFIRPGEWIVEAGNTYGSFVVSAAAMSSLSVSDGLTQAQIENCLRVYPFGENTRAKSPLLSSNQAIRDTAACLYAYQEETGTSVCGLLGIMKQEGGFASGITRKGWNFFNISVGSSGNWTGIEGYSRFRDYKKVYENGDGIYATPAVNAFAAQIGWINNSYWKRGQDSYYLMCFNGYDYTKPNEAYYGISHSYCPPWDDQAMPYSRDSYTISINANNEVVTNYYWRNADEDNRGWVNGCARARRSFAEYMH